MLKGINRLTSQLITNPQIVTFVSKRDFTLDVNWGQI